MSAIDKLTQTVHEIEKDSLLFNKNNDMEDIMELKEHALLSLAKVKVSMDNPMVFGHKHLYAMLENKLIQSINRIDVLLEG